MRISYDKINDQCYNESAAFWTEACRDPLYPMNETQR